MNIPNTEARGITESNRRLLEVLHRQIYGPFSVDDACRIWKFEHPRAGRLLAHFAARGWLTRVRRGSYSLVPLGATSPGDWREDPWLIAMSTFSPCYLGGWTACAHWELTEQIFRDLLVISSRPFSRRQYEIQGTSFRLKVVAPDKMFGLTSVWRGQSRVMLSDPSRTIVDVLADPATGGGIRHVGSVTTAYFESSNRDDDKVIDYAKRFGNRTVFKRLGYLIEALSVDAQKLVGVCQDLMSSGIAVLDPTLPRRGKILSRWRLLQNARMMEEQR